MTDSAASGKRGFSDAFRWLLVRFGGGGVVPGLAGLLCRCRDDPNAGRPDGRRPANPGTTPPLSAMAATPANRVGEVAGLSDSHGPAQPDKTQSPIL